MNLSAFGFSSTVAWICDFCMLVSSVAVALKVARVFWFTEYLVAALAGTRPMTNRSAAADIVKNLFIVLPDRHRLLPCSPKPTPRS